jgi:transcriptional regulator with XRE-family HTH domain
VGAKKSAHNVALGEAMRSARRERVYSQEVLAGQIGLDRSYYGAIERGGFSPTADTVAKVATGLGLSLRDLFTRARL